MRIFYDSPSMHKGYQPVVQQGIYTGAQLLHHLGLALPYLPEIRPDIRASHAVRPETDSELPCRPRLFQDLCTAAEYFRRDTSFVEACPSDIPLFNEDYLHSPFCSLNGRLVSSRTRSYYDYLHFKYF